MQGTESSKSIYEQFLTRLSQENSRGYTHLRKGFG